MANLAGIGRGPVREPGLRVAFVAGRCARCAHSVRLGVRLFE